MRNLICNVTRWMVLVVSMLIFCFTQNTFAQTEARIVHFPKDRSMGMLYVQDANMIDKISRSNWEVYCEAIGDVTLPPGKVLNLALDSHADGDLSPLAAFMPNEFIVLICSRVDIPDEQLQYISHLTDMRELDMSSTGIRGTGLRCLTNMRSLEILNLSDTSVGDDELVYISNLPSLEYLYLEWTPTTDAGMVHVGRITSLERLILSNGVGDDGLARLKGLKNLRSLCAGGIVMLSEFREPTAGGYLMDNEDMRMKVKRSLGMHSDETSKIGSRGIKAISKLMSLEELILFNTKLTVEDFKVLGGMKSLRRLSLKFIRSDVTDEHIAQLSGLQSLRELTINAVCIEDGKAKYFMNVTDEALGYISNLKSLRRLVINGATFSDDGLQQLAVLPNLKYLFLHGCYRITDQGIERLAEKIPNINM